MTKKGKRAALLQRDGQISGLQAENERLRARLAGYEKGARVSSPGAAPAAAAGDEVRLYRLLADNATDVIWTVDAGLKLTYVSPSVTRVLGYSPDEVMGKPFTEMFPPATLDLVARLHAEDMATEARQPGGLAGRLEDFEVLARDGSPVWVEAVISPLRDADGRWTGFQGACREVTERRRAQQALAASEERFRTIFERSPIGAVIYDADGAPLEVNRACVDIFGSSRDGVVHGPSLFDYRGLEGDARGRLRSGETITVELPVDLDAARESGLFSTDGSGKLYVRMIAAPIGMEGDGSPRGYLGMVEDVTGRRQMEEALRLSEERNRLLVEHANEAITIIQDGAIRFVNPKLAELTGFAEGELLGKAYLEMVHPDDREVMADHYLRRLAGEDVPQIYQFRFVDRGGRTRWAEINAVVVEWEGRPATLALFSDITARRQAEDALQRQERFFRAVTENSTDGILVADRGGNVKYESPGALRLLGLSEARTGQPVTGPMHPDDLPAAAEVLGRVLSGRPARVEMRARHADGSWRTIDSNLVNLLDDPAVEGIVVNMRDVTERQRAEESLRASEERNRLLVENMNEAIAVVQDRFVRFANQKTVELGGYTIEEFASTPFMDLVHPDDRERVAEYHAGRMRGDDVPSSYEMRTITKGGDIRWVEMRAAVLEWEGRPAALALMHDITQRKKAEEALQESEERYRLLAENASDVIWTMDLNMTYTYNSSSKLRQSGYTPEEFRGLSAAQVLTPESLECAVRAFQEELALEQQPDQDPQRTRVLELAERRKDGSLLWTEATASFLRDKDGRAIGVIGISRDVTERKKAEEALRESQARLRREEHLFRMLTESSQDLVVLINPDGTVRYESPAVEHILGFKPEERVGANVFELLHPDDVPKVRASQEKLRIGPEAPPERFEMRLRHRDGSWRTIDAVAGVIVGEGGVEGVMVNLRDMTERKKAEEALREAKEYAENVIRTASVLVVVLDTEGRAALLNEAGEKMTGYSQAEVVGRDWFELMVPRRQYPQVWEEFERVRTEGTIAETFENPILTKSGEERTISWKNSVLVRGGQVAGTLSFGMDVTERKKAEEALREAHAGLEARVEQRTAELKEANRHLVEEMRRRQEAQGRLQESESRYRGLVESANSIIMELDTRGRVTFFNRFAQEFYGFDESEIMGRPVVGTIAPPVDSAGHDTRAAVRDLVRHPEQWAAVEGEGMRRNGERVWISWTNKGLCDSSGRLRNVLCIGMDRTEQRRTSDLLAEQLKEKAASEERQRLARELHDAVTQMLFSASIIAGVLPRLWERDHEEARRRLEELRQLTRGALAEMRLLLLELRPAAMAEVGLADLLRHLAEATSGRAGFPVSFSMEGQCTLTPDVQMALYRVAQEALANAAKHSRATEARVQLLCGRQSATLVVADNGCGFDLKKVSPDHLGLRIMQERAEAAGAELTVASSKRRGTEVTVAWSGSGRKERA